MVEDEIASVSGMRSPHVNGFTANKTTDVFSKPSVDFLLSFNAVLLLLKKNFGAQTEFTSSGISDGFINFFS